VHGRLVRTLVPLVAIPIACGVNSLEEREQVDAARAVEERDEVIVELEVPTSVGTGKPVPMRLRVRTEGADPKPIGLTGRPIAFDLVVKSADGREVWRRLHGVSISMILQIALLRPGEVLNFTDTWNQRDNHGEVVPPGRYYVHGVLPTDEGDLSTEVRELVIVDR